MQIKVKYAANIITALRLVFSILLLFFSALSIPFFAFYSLAGLSDMADGAVARKTKSTSEFGARLDSVADLVFVFCSLLKLIPVLKMPIWICIWIGVIALIKVINMISGFAVQKKLVFEHRHSGFEPSKVLTVPFSQILR